MNLITRKNELMFLAAAVVILIFVMGYSLYQNNSFSSVGSNSNAVPTPMIGTSDEISDIEEDLLLTEIDDVDSELQEIELELGSN